ncbi:hypothetical protein KKE34_01215 [Patescibacteria group bacterium]|nr:hypothetical protein [Patescibacteria group bacterium]
MRSLLVFSFIFFISAFSSIVHAKEVGIDKIFVKPIPGLEVGIFGISPNKIIESIVNNNYQVFCANEPTTINPQISGAYDRYLDLYGTPVKLNPTAHALLDEGLLMRTPLIRNSGGEQIDPDYESYIGNYEVDEDLLATEPFLEDILTADFYKKLSLVEQCEVAKQSLFNITTQCEKITGKCPADIEIPNTNGKYKISTLKTATDGIDCKELKKSEYLQELNKSDPNILKGLANTPYFQVNTYKPAFLVSATEQKPSGEEGRLFENWTTSFLDWFIKPGDKISVKVILLPTSGMEENPDDDPIQFHKLSLQISTDQKSWDKEKDKDNINKTNRLKKAIKAFSKGFDNGDRINCVNCNTGSTKDIYTAIAHYINSENPPCGDTIITEISEEIDSPANIPEDLSYSYSGGKTPFSAFVGGILDKIVGVFNTNMTVGNIPKNEITAKKAKFETFIIAPYAQKDTVYNLLASLEEQAEYENRLEQLPSQVKFNKVDDKVDSKSNSKSFYDPDKCKTDTDGDGINDADCNNSFTIGLGKIDRDISLEVSHNVREGTSKVQSLLYPEYLSDGTLNPAQANIRANESDTEKFLVGNKDSKEGEEDLGKTSEDCEEYKNTVVELPTMKELEKMVCSIAGGNSNDAQMLWGIMQIEGSPFLRQIRAGATSMSCGDLITNACGASQITGNLVPACIDEKFCSQAAYIKESEPLPINAACDVEGSLKYTLRKRKSEISWLKGQYSATNGSDPSTKQLYYMMAGRNYGVPTANLVQPACGNYEEVQGCSGANYCVCAMDIFKFSCN